MGNRIGRRNNRGRKASLTSDAHSTSKETLEQIMRRGPISKYYTVYEQVELGRGHYAVVNLAVEKKSKKNFAVKRIQIRKSRLESLQLEVHVLMHVGAHPNIVTLHDIFITETEVQLVMELLTGGELFDRMVESGPYTEQEASNHVGKIAHALKYLHSKNVVHRDLKPENLILASKEPNAELKMADFGLSKFVDSIEDSKMKTVCGTWAYCAPEVRQSIKQGGNEASYTAKVDVWSTGVIMFVMLSAYHPFDPNGDLSDQELWANICSGEFNFDDPAWVGISDMAKDLIRHMIVKDPKQRYTPEQVLEHPWIKRNAEVPVTPMTTNLHLFQRRNYPRMFGAKSPMTGVPMRAGTHQHVPMLNHHAPNFQGNNNTGDRQDVEDQEMQLQMRQQQLMEQEQQIQQQQQHLEQLQRQLKEQQEEIARKQQEQHQRELELRQRQLLQQQFYEEQQTAQNNGLLNSFSDGIDNISPTLHQDSNHVPELSQLDHPSFDHRTIDFHESEHHESDHVMSSNVHVAQSLAIEGVTEVHNVVMSSRSFNDVQHQQHSISPIHVNGKSARHEVHEQLSTSAPIIGVHNHLSNHSEGIMESTDHPGLNLKLEVGDDGMCVVDDLMSPMDIEFNE